MGGAHIYQGRRGSSPEESEAGERMAVSMRIDRLVRYLRATSHLGDTAERIEAREELDEARAKLARMRA